MTQRDLKTRTHREFDYEVQKESERGAPVYWARGSGFETDPHRTPKAADRAARREINKHVKSGASAIGCLLPILLAVLLTIALDPPARVGRTERGRQEVAIRVGP